MNNNNRHINNINNINSNSHLWMMPPENGPESYNYMASRPPGSVLPMPSLQLQHNPSMHQPQHEQELSVSPPAQALDYDHPRFHKGGNRAVIPSKRAAQNRAAQKAFRQRREQYIKDLEIKAKEMEDWQNEMDSLRKENGELRGRISTLEHQVKVLTGGDPSKVPSEVVSKLPSTVDLASEEQVAETSVDKNLERSISLPIPSIMNKKDEIVSRESELMLITAPSAKSPNSDSRLRHEREHISQQVGSFGPVALKAPSQAGFEPKAYHPSDQVSRPKEKDYTTDFNSKRRKLENSLNLSPNSEHAVDTTIKSAIFSDLAPQTSQSSTLSLPIQNQPQPNQHQQQQQQQQQSSTSNDYWGNNNTQVSDFDLDFNFDPFFEDEFGPTLTSNNDFLPNANSGQVLDDLFAMLQTRQRPQIPILPSDDNSSFSNNNGSNLL